MVKNRHGYEVNYLMAIAHMTDDSILDAIVKKCGPCAPQRFFNEYEEEYLRRHGTEWEMSGHI